MKVATKFMNFSVEMCNVKGYRLFVIFVVQDSWIDTFSAFIAPIIQLSLRQHLVFVVCCRSWVLFSRTGVNHPYDRHDVYIKMLHNLR